MLIEEARQLRRRRWSFIIVAIVAIVVVVAVLGVLTSGSGARTLPTMGAKNPTFHLAPLAKSSTDNGLLDYLMPRNGADFAEGMTFLDRMGLAAASVQLSCMARVGEPATGRITDEVSAGDNLDFPDLAVLSAGTFQSVASDTLYQFNGPDAAKGMKTSAFDLARQHCGKSAYGAEERLLETGGIVDTWESTMQPALNRSASFRHLLVGYDACVRRAGLSRSGPNGIWSDNDALEPKIGAMMYAAVLHERSSVYARCIASAELWRDQIRWHQRAQMVRSHQAELSRLETDVYAYLRVGPARTGWAAESLN